MGKQIWTALVSLPLLHDLRPVAVQCTWPVPGVGLTISLISRDNLIMCCLCGRPLDPGHRNWVRSQVTPTHPVPTNKMSRGAGLSYYVFYGEIAKLGDFFLDHRHSVINAPVNARVMTGELECIILLVKCLISRRIFPHTLSPVWFSPGVTLAAQSMAGSSDLGPRPGPD